MKFDPILPKSFLFVLTVNVEEGSTVTGWKESGYRIEAYNFCLQNFFVVISCLHEERNDKFLIMLRLRLVRLARFVG